MLESIPVPRSPRSSASGHDGTWGVKTEYFENSMKIGRPVFRQMAEPGPQYVSSDCPIAARHVLQGMEDAAKGVVKAHPSHPATHRLRHLAFLLVTGCAPLTPLPAGHIGFGVLGDARLYGFRSRALEGSSARSIPSRWTSWCTSATSAQRAQRAATPGSLERKKQFARIRHRFILLPGGNGLE